MANNTAIQTPTVPGDVISTEEIGAYKVPRNKIILGAAGVDGGDVTVANPFPVRGSKTSVSATFTRPANTTAYSVGDVVSNSATTTTPMTFALFARENAGSGYVISARLHTNLKSITPRFRVHLFNASDATIAADNLAWRETDSEFAKRLGYFDLPAMTTGADTTNSDMSRSLDMNLRFPFIAAAGTQSIFAVLETLDAFTPASAQTFRLTLAAELD